MNVIFAGTPEFAARCLKSLHESKHQVIAVLTQPDRHSGRGRKLVASPVKILALDCNIRVYQPESLKEKSSAELIRSFNADVMVVAAYGLILPAQILEIPALGCLNIHASLLPRWRGAAPIQRAIQAGDNTTGISIIQMDEGLDSGNVLAIQEISIDEHDTSRSLHDKLALLARHLIVAILDQLKHGSIKPQPQDESGVTYAAKLNRDESKIDWSLPANTIVNLINALNPKPGAKTHYEEIELKILQATLINVENSGRPGMILLSKKEIVIQTGKGQVKILTLQKPGSTPMSAKTFLNGFKMESGKLLN